MFNIVSGLLAFFVISKSFATFLSVLVSRPARVLSVLSTFQLFCTALVLLAPMFVHLVGKRNTVKAIMMTIITSTASVDSHGRIERGECISRIDNHLAYYTKVDTVSQNCYPLRFSENIRQRLRICKRNFLR